MSEYIVELEHGVWIASWRGDPGRTLVKNSAKRFLSMAAATRALARARAFGDFCHAAIEEAPNE